MTDTEKIDGLRKLLGTIVTNTKAVAEGRMTNDQREIQCTKRVLKGLLGREPSDQEVQLATKF